MPLNNPSHPGTQSPGLIHLVESSEADSAIRIAPKTSSDSNLILGDGAGILASQSCSIVNSDHSAVIVSSSKSISLGGSHPIIDTAENSVVLGGQSSTIQSNNSVALGYGAVSMTENSLTIGGGNALLSGQLVIACTSQLLTLGLTQGNSQVFPLGLTDKQASNLLDFSAKALIEIIIKSDNKLEGHSLKTTVSREGDGSGVGFSIGHQEENAVTPVDFYCTLVTSSSNQVLGLEITRVSGTSETVEVGVSSFFTMLVAPPLPPPPPPPPPVEVGFYLDPILGSNTTGNGSISNPYGRLDEFIATPGLLEKVSETGVVTSAGIIKGGDTLLLKTGYHGDISLNVTYFSSALTIKAASVTDYPRIGSFKLKAGSNIVLDRLEVNGSLGADLNAAIPIIQIATSTNVAQQSQNITIKNCYITSGSGYSAWLTADWTAKSKTGINISANASNITVKNCEIIATKIGINTLNNNAVIEGNIVEFWSQDGIRVAGSNVMVKYNYVTNNVSDNGNHDDAGQMYSLTGNSNVTWLKNICLERTTAANTFITGTQGFGGFDGVYTNVRIEGNVYKGSGIHGVALYDAVNSFLIDNFAVGFNGVGGRVSLGTKVPNLNSGNTVTGNTANLVDASIDPSAIVANNTTLVYPDETGFSNRLAALQAEISSLYGATRQLTGTSRF
jgi:hypothetical protein